MKMNKMLRGWEWLVIAVAIAFVMSSEIGSGTFLQAWIVSAAKAASGVWIGYWASKNICHIDPSEEKDHLAQAELKKARAICIAGLAIAVAV